MGASRKEARRELARRVGRAQPQFIAVEAMLRDKGIVPEYWELNESGSQVADGCAFQLHLEWSTFPEAATLQGASLPADRIERKTLQIENMIWHARILIRQLLTRSNVAQRSALHIVDFCGGSGSISLPLAVLYPEHRFTMVDCKSASVDMARERAASAGVSNLRIVEQKIEDFAEPFDLGLALHACGSATDLVLQACLRTSAAFVLCSCCVGKVTFSRNSPLSQQLQPLLTTAEFCSLIKAADFGHADFAGYSSQERQRRYCKSLIEEDRLLFAKERGYCVQLHLMRGGFSSVKCDVLTGSPNEDLTADCLFRRTKLSLETFLFPT